MLTGHALRKLLLMLICRRVWTEEESIKITSSRQWKRCWYKGTDPGKPCLLTLPKSCKDTKGLVIWLKCDLNSVSKSLDTC